MKSKQSPKGQSSLFKSLKDTINPKHHLYLLEKLIPWSEFDEAYSDSYSDYGRPAKPIRLMVSLMILKHTYNLSDEETVSNGKRILIGSTFQVKKSFNGVTLAILQI